MDSHSASAPQMRATPVGAAPAQDVEEPLLPWQARIPVYAALLALLYLLQPWASLHNLYQYFVYTLLVFMPLLVYVCYRKPSAYGKRADLAEGRSLPTRLAWVLMEAPAVMTPPIN